MSLAYKYSYRRTLPHIQKENRSLFITFSTYKRWMLPSAVRGLVLESCLHQNGTTVELLAAVVMPDHVHLICTPLKRPDQSLYCLPEIMHAIKGRSAHAVNLALTRKGRVGQEEFFDHVLRSNESLQEKITYICENPIRAGLVGEAQEYPWLWRGTGSAANGIQHAVGL